MNRAKAIVACCDIGGTKGLVGLVGPAGALLAAEKYTLGTRTQPEQVMADVNAAMERLLAQTGHDRAQVAGMGCSITGVIDVFSGVMFTNHNMGWPERVPFRDLFAHYLGLPVAVEMDANAAALGEAWRGHGRGLRSFAYVIVGTGIGAGLIVDGRVVRGAHSTAGEIGHTVIVPGGPLCGCGKHGCLEALASGLAVARMAQAALTLGRGTALREAGEPLTAARVAAAARDGDAVAREVFDTAAYYLGIGIANLITLIDPEAVILGGGVAQGASDLLLPGVRRSVHSHLNAWAARDIPILITALGDHAGLLGAARAAQQTLPLSSEET